MTEELNVSEVSGDGPMARAEKRRRAYVTNLITLFAIGVVAALAFALSDDLGTLFGFDFLREFASLTRVYAGLFILLAIFGALGIATQAYLKDGTFNPFSDIYGLSEVFLDEPDDPDRSDSPKPHSSIAAPAKTPSETISADISTRLEAEIENQDRKANLNLILGGTGAVVSTGILAVSVFMPPHLVDARAFWFVAGARSLLSLSASVFAFFFLSTYRRNLTEGRYFQNELTNFQSRLLAVRLHQEMSLVKADRGDEPLLAMLGLLAATERNFILRKGETTTDLLQKDFDRQDNLALMATLSTLAGQAAQTSAPAVAPPRTARASAKKATSQ